MPPYELAIECTQATRGMSDAHCHSSMLRFHLDFIHVLKYLLHDGCMGIYSPWMGNARMRMCLCASHAEGPFDGEQGLRHFQFPEVSAGPEDDWKLIYRLSRRPYCEASLHTQISWNIREWIQSFCQSRIRTGSNSNGWFPDYIHKQQVNLFCSLAEQTHENMQNNMHIYTKRKQHMHAVMQLQTNIHWNSVVTFSMHLSLFYMMSLFVMFCMVWLMIFSTEATSKRNMNEVDDPCVKMSRTKGLSCCSAVFQLDLSCCRPSLPFFIFCY